MAQRVRTRAFDIARQLGWSDGELARRSGLSQPSVTRMRRGGQGIGARAIQGFLQAFPQHNFHSLFWMENDPEPAEKVGAA